MKTIILICFIISQILLTIQIGINIIQTRQISCLEKDMIYVGFTFCAKKGEI